MTGKPMKVILGTGLMLLVFIIVSVSLIQFTLDLVESIDTDMVVINIEYTDNGNVIIMHERGPSIDTEYIKIMVDDEKIDIDFEDEKFSRSESIIFDETQNGEEFTGGEKIDVYVGEENITTKIIPHN